MNTQEVIQKVRQLWPEASIEYKPFLREDGTLGESVPFINILDGTGWHSVGYMAPEIVRKQVEVAAFERLSPLEKVCAKIRISDLFEDDFGSYIADTEWNLKHDAVAWEKYQADPYPFLHDLVMDFGTFRNHISPEASKDPQENLRWVEAIATAAVNRYLGRIK